MREEILRRIRDRIGIRNEPVAKTANGIFIILGEEFCPNCALMKEMYAEEMLRGEVIYVSSDSDQGKKISNMFEINEVPAIIFYNTDTGKHVLCDFYYDDDGNIIFECESYGQ
jgi:hypothetical protein